MVHVQKFIIIYLKKYWENIIYTYMFDIPLKG